MGKPKLVTSKPKQGFSKSAPDPLADLVRKADRDPLIRSALLQAIAKGNARAQSRKKLDG